ncbi:MAG TPA: hypothetical protein VLQ45_26540 [Thermoanaerobaculia bacterium]|nr:hypothetical protein [Thermoanaerobaculia bacterium]
MKPNAASSLRPPLRPVILPEEIVNGTVTITPSEGSSPFVLSGSGNQWSTTDEELALQPDSLAPIRYNITFTLSSSSHTFASPALEISQGNQNAFICQPHQSEGATVAVSFLNAVTQQINYNLGFRINTPSGTINWDPAVAFNPPD